MIEYIPAISGALTFASKQSWAQGSVDMRWWKENHPIRRKSLLISYFYGYQNKNQYGFDHWRDVYEVPKDVMVYGDSGGYSQWSQGERFNPSTVFNWQAQNCDIAFILDLPPRGLHAETISDGHFQDCARFTEKSIREIKSEAQKHDVKLYGVLHGISYREIKFWWKNVIEPHLDLFDGIACSPRPPNDSVAAALHLSFLREKGIKNVHIFAMSGQKGLISGAYFSKDFNKLTSDTSSFSMLAGRGKIMLTPFITDQPAGDSADKLNIDYSIFPCICPFCKDAESKGIQFTKFSETLHYLYGYLHNLYKLFELEKFANWLALNDDIFQKYIKKYPRVEEAVEIYDKAKEKGFEDAWGGYREAPNLQDWL